MKKRIILSILGSCILAFGLYQVHSIGIITEGGTLGMTLLLHHWFHISPAVSGFILNGICYLAGIYILGREFLLFSFLSGSSFSLFYWIFEQHPLLWPTLIEKPFIAAVLGACFVGIGVGLCVRAGGAPSGDDALAMTMSKLTKWPIQNFYLITDLTVLLLSLTYIPIQRIIYSLVTVILSGQIIGWMQKSHGN